MKKSPLFSSVEKKLRELPGLLESLLPPGPGLEKVTKILASVQKEVTALEKKSSEKEDYNRIFQLAPFGVFLIDGKGFCKDVNDAASRQTGYSREELLNMNAKDLINPSDYENGSSHFKRLVETGSSRGEMKIKCKDGSYFRMEVDAFRFSENLFIGFTKDISKQKEYETRLQDSIQRYSILSEIAEEGIFIHENGKIIEVNRALCKLLGYKYKELIGMEGTILLTERSNKKLMKAISNNYLKPIEVEMIRKNGDKFFVETYGKSYLKDGKTHRVVIVNDISEKKERELALKQSSEQLKGAGYIFNNMQSGIYIYHIEDINDDRSLRMVAGNPSSEKLTGIKVEDVVGKTLDENFPLLRERGYPQKYAEVIRTGKPHAFEDLTYSDERIIKSAFSVKAFPLPNNHVGVSFENITKRKIAEEELKTRNAELNNFVYKVSHDLRAPLSSIKGLIHLSKLEKGPDEYLKRMEGSIEKLDGFIRNVLSHSRNLNTVPKRDKIDFKKKIGQCFHELSHLPGSDIIERIINSEKAEFYSDSVRIFEIFRNLISNAIKYQDPEKTEHLVKIDITVSDKSVNISIEDNGIGIAKEHLSRIFDMFYRAHDISDGSGIGLYIVNEAVKKLDGSIIVTSEKDVGTRFEIELPNMAKA